MGKLFIIVLQKKRWRRQWHPTPVLLPGKSHRRRSLVGCSPWGHEESDMTERIHFHFYALEKEMATHSSVLAWRIPGMGEPGGLPFTGSHRVRHDWRDLAAAAAAFFIVQLWYPYMTAGKTIALTRPTFVGKVMSLLFNMISRLVITFFPRSKHFNFMAAITICSDFGAQKNKVSHCFHCFPIYCPWSNGTGCHDLRFLNVEL